MMEVIVLVLRVRYKLCLAEVVNVMSGALEAVMQLFQNYRPIVASSTKGIEIHRLPAYLTVSWRPPRVYFPK